MTRFLESSRFLVLIGVIFLMLAALAAFVWDAIKTVKLLGVIVYTAGQSPEIAIALIQLVDAFLIATALLIVSTSLYELIVGDLNLPDSLVARDFNQLKAKLSNVVILVMAVTFLEHLVDWKNGLETLYFGIAVALVSAALIAFSYLGSRSGAHD